MKYDMILKELKTR